MTLLDAYALVSGPAVRIRHDGVELVPLFDDIAAACRIVEAPPVPDAVSLRAHDQSIRALDEHFAAVLPIRFGTVVPDAESLRAALWSSRDRIAETLARVDGCVQFTVRLFAARPEASVSAHDDRGPGARYLEARRDALATRLARATHRLAPLEPLRREERRELHDVPPLDASVYHLVPREHVARYESALAALVDTPDAIRLRASGPWPVYAFAPREFA